MDVRRVGPGDGALVRDVRLRALRSDPDSFGSTAAREEAWTDAEWEDWAAVDVDGTDGATFLALREGDVVGVAAGHRDRADGRFHVVAMWVAPEARGRGVAAELLAAVEAWIAGAGGDAAWLSVTERAAGARRLYERAGYVATGVVAESPHTPGLLHAELRKDLGARGRGRS